jgi:hypothetical protein
MIKLLLDDRVALRENRLQSEVAKHELKCKGIFDLAPAEQRTPHLNRRRM